MSHSTNEVPYDKRLAKKKKFSKPKPPAEPLLNDPRLVGTGTEKEQYIKVHFGTMLKAYLHDKLFFLSRTTPSDIV
jgi:hypothetical protein